MGGPDQYATAGGFTRNTRPCQKFLSRTSSSLPGKRNPEVPCAKRHQSATLEPSPTCRTKPDQGSAIAEGSPVLRAVSPAWRRNAGSDAPASYSCSAVREGSRETCILLKRALPILSSFQWNLAKTEGTSTWPKTHL